ncbi:TnsA endonuclease N-terminal domain-containing protein [Lysinibacillus sphaericus]|uniref:TnsA endonuclease N-terminal domain-containing protein n=1 Tax=Lysinibacillus sphaericus TaxID=1421 RepID=UPI001F50F43B|nr:TnsA endonuclease N-terminal domain-containing protein [Lysinibacillus sphaericus]
MKKDLMKLFLELNIEENVVKKIECIRRSQPSRKVRSSGKNVSGFYPSEKMGVTIQFESRTLELAAIYEKEFDSNVVEYYDQPETFPIRYQNKGRNTGHYYTPDFFVIEKEWIGYEEWKTEKELSNLTLKYPGRYCIDETGAFRCPPAEEYAKACGLSFRIRTSSEIDWTLQRNIRFLEDYLIGDKTAVSSTRKDLIINLIAEKPGISLERLLNMNLDFSADDIYHLLAQNEIYADIKETLITDFDKFSIYLNKESANAFYNMANANVKDTLNISALNIYPLQPLLWSAEPCTILSISESSISIMNGEQEVKIPHVLFEKLYQEGTIKPLNDTNNESTTSEKVIDIILSASPKSLEEANRKYCVLQNHWNGISLEELKVSPRTFRDWVKKYKDAQSQFGNGFVGLLNKRNNQGNRERKLSPEIIELMDEYIKEKYENPRSSNLNSIYKRFYKECIDRGWTPPSNVTFWQASKKRSIHVQTEKRKGPKAAYDTEKFYFEIQTTTPRHGDFPYQICHLDHTELDIELICSDTHENLGRPWLSLLIDAYSRRVLAFYLTFDPPSYRSCMMVLRECVKRNSRLPKMLVVDGGKEFHSVYFDTLLAKYNVTKAQRPGAKPKFGSVCERMFGTTNTEFIHNLLGNTQIMKKVREVTKKFNPKHNAIWTFESLHEMMDEWCYQIYDQQIHLTLGTSPRNFYENRLYKTGKREHTFIRYDELFEIMTLPSTSKQKAKIQPGRGVRINNIYYWGDMLDHPELEGQSVFVRYDPFDMSTAYAYVNKYWIKLRSENFMLFENRTEKEIQMATIELRKRMKNAGKAVEITGKIIANFLDSAESKEVLQIQHLKDRAAKLSTKVTDGEDNQSNNNAPKFKGKHLSIVSEESITPSKKQEEIDTKKFITYEEF